MPEKARKTTTASSDARRSDEAGPRERTRSEAPATAAPLGAAPQHGPAASALDRAIEAMVVGMEARGHRVRGATLAETTANLQQLRQAHPELFGLMDKLSPFARRPSRPTS